MEHRLPHNLNISFAYVEGESLLMGINDVAVSSGSACTSASLEPSYVLKALGAGDDLAHSSIRFGLGRWTTEEEVDYVVEKLTTVVRRLREMSPLYEMVKEGVDLSKMQWVDALRPSGRLMSEHLDGPESKNGLFRTRSSITTRTRATSARCRRTTPTSAPAWSARRSAATS